MDNLNSSFGAFGGGYAVDLGFFSGPMDLLLHLVQAQEVAVEDVEMTVIVEQYLEIINNAVNIDLEKAGEYLVVAATLLSIKSQRLLPVEEEMQEDNVDVDRADPEFLEELRQRIKRYELTKQRAMALRNTPQFGVDTFTRVDKASLQPSPEEIGEGSDPSRLGNLFSGLLKRIGASASRFKVHVEPVSVVQYMMKTINCLQDRSTPRSFLQIVSSFLAKKGDNVVTDLATLRSESKNAVIGSFLATLELVKRGLIRVKGDNVSNEFSLELGILPEGSYAKEELINVGDFSNNEFDNVVSLDSPKEKEAVEESFELERLEANRD